MIKTIGAKYIGRSLSLWNGEAKSFGLRNQIKIRMNSLITPSTANLTDLCALYCFRPIPN
jgi:hypothetical protein